MRKFFPDNNISGLNSSGVTEPQKERKTVLLHPYPLVGTCRESVMVLLVSQAVGKDNFDFFSNCWLFVITVRNRVMRKRRIHLLSTCNCCVSCCSFSFKLIAFYYYGERKRVNDKEEY